MSDYIVYHNPDRRQFPASEVTKFVVLTDKSASGVVGNRVWLITGEGQPRRYFLVLWFIADIVESGEDEGFRTRIAGGRGHKFDPMIPLDDEEWFQELKRTRANFSLGFGPMNESMFVEGFERLVATVKPVAEASDS